MPPQLQEQARFNSVKNSEAVKESRSSLGLKRKDKKVTLNQLLKEVYALGFDNSEGLEETFVFSVNRALKMIFTELGPQKRARISVAAASEKSFSLSDYVKRPLMITAPPKDTLGNLIRGAFSDGLYVTLPDSFVGDVVITYRPMPEEVSLDSGDESVDIPPYAEHLLPLLTSFFVHLDDDPEKAETYMSVYRNEAKRIWMTYSPSQENSYIDVTGWAT